MTLREARKTPSTPNVMACAEDVPSERGIGDMVKQLSRAWYSVDNEVYGNRSFRLEELSVG
jgi:hypothetical protein